MNASHLETMEELSAIYAQEGDRENKRKYEQKIQLIRKNMQEDQKALKQEIEEEDKNLQEREPEEQKPEFIEEIKEDIAEKKGRIRRLDGKKK